MSINSGMASLTGTGEERHDPWHKRLLYGGTVTFGAGDSIANVTTGLLVDDINFQNTTIGGLTLNNLAFSNVSGNYVTLQNFALLGPKVLDATSATFNGVTGAQMTNAQELNATEQKLRHYPVDSFVGLIILKYAYAVIDATTGNLLVIGTQGADNIVARVTSPTLANATVQINGICFPNPDPLSNGIFHAAERGGARFENGRQSGHRVSR